MARQSLGTFIALAALVVFGSWGWDSPAQADDTAGVNVNPDQIKLVERAIEALDAGDIDKGKKLLRAALHFGELNVALVHMGRLQLASGECLEASATLARAENAPKVAEPTPDAVEKIRVDLMGRLQRECPGTLEIVCDRVTGAVFVDGVGPSNCGDRLELEPGEHAVELRGPDGIDRRSAAVVAFKETQLIFVKIPSPEPRPDVVVTDTSSDSPATVDATTWWLGGGAAAGLAGAIALDTIPASASNHEAEAMDFVPVALYVGAAALATYAIVRIVN